VYSPDRRHELPETSPAALGGPSPLRHTLQDVPAAYLALMPKARKREGLRICRAAWLLGLTVRQYRALEAGELMPDTDLWHRMVDVFNWPRSW
jgi:hypothetical protein